VNLLTGLRKAEAAAQKLSQGAAHCSSAPDSIAGAACRSALLR